jgi:hypothetical protein
MPDENSDKSLTELSESEEETPEKYTDEWYDSVEQRFKDVGDYMRALESKRGAPSHGRKQAAAAASAETVEGQSAPDASADGAISAPSVRDTRPPRSNHIWFRRLGE